MKKISDKLVLITGASSGIGAETAKVISSKDATVILLARNSEKLEQVAAQIKQQGGKSYYYAVDLSNCEQVESTAQRIKKDIGIPDIIINNAGVGRWLTIEETSAEELKEMIALPYLAAFYITKAFITEMKMRGTGHIINLTSDASFLPKGMALGYSAARFALRGFSEGLRGYLLISGINVSLAVFGKVESSYWENNPGSEKRIPKSTPFMPVLTTNQVANYIVEMIEKNKRILIKPGIFRTLFWSFLHWPDKISERMNKTV